MPRKKETTISTDAPLEEFKEELLAEVIEQLDQEIPVAVTTESVPKRYIANIYYEKEPMAKDIYAGSFVYWDSTHKITWEELTPHYSTDLELLSQGDALVTKEGRSYLISRWETPKEWLVNLPFASLGGRYICKDIVELYETE